MPDRLGGPQKRGEVVREAPRTRRVRAGQSMPASARTAAMKSCVFSSCFENSIAAATAADGRRQIFGGQSAFCDRYCGAIHTLATLPDRVFTGLGNCAGALGWRRGIDRVALLAIAALSLAHGPVVATGSAMPYWLRKRFSARCTGGRDRSCGRRRLLPSGGAPAISGDISSAAVASGTLSPTGEFPQCLPIFPARRLPSCDRHRHDC